MQKIIRFFFYHHMIIALSAVALCMQTFLFLQVDIFQFSLLLFVFSATLLSYNVHFFLAAEKSQSSQQLQWFAKTRTFTLVFNIVTLLFTLWYWWQIREISLYIILSIFINASYTAPLLLNKPLQLPGFLTFIKSYLIGFVWAYVTVVLPVAFAQLPFGINECFLFINRLLLVAIATLIFDYRDKLRDFEFGVYTPANKMNEQQFSLFFSANIAVYFLSVLLLSYRFSDYQHLWQLVNCIVLLYLFRQSKKQRNDFFYLGWVDAVLILSLLLSLFLLF
jgi:hypothetical protein